MTQHITQLINFYLYRYNVPESIQEDVAQDVWCDIAGEEGEVDSNKILEFFGNAVKSYLHFSESLPGYPWETIEEDNYTEIMDMDLTLITQDDDQRSSLITFMLGLSPDQQQFKDLSLSEEQFKMYEKQYHHNNTKILNAYKTCNPDPPYAPENPERIPKKVKKFGEGHILYAKRLYRMKNGVVETIAELHNQGMGWREIYRHFVYPPGWNGRHTTKPKATPLDIKAVLQCMAEVSEEQLRAWLQINREHLPVHIDTPDTLNCIGDLEDLEAFLNIQLDLPCKIIHDYDPYILVKRKCKTCNGGSQIRIYASDSGFTFSCGRCSAKGNHYGIYRRAGGNSLEGALRHLNITTRGDYEV